MKGWILYHRNQQELTEANYNMHRFIEAAEKKGVELEIFKPDEFDLIVSRTDNKSVLVNGVTTPMPDFFLPRTGSGTTYFASAVIRQFEKLDVYVCNTSHAIDTVKDKLKIHQILAQSNLPTPKTMLLKFPFNVELVKKEIGFPLIIKNVTGSEGKGIYLCETAEKFKDIMELLYSYNKNMNIIIQQFVKESSGRDLRVFVVGGQVIGCMQRTAKEGFKSNYALGASVSPFEVTQEIEWISTEAVKLLGLDIAGVDLLFHNDGFKVLEVNSAPDFKGMEEVIGHTVPEKIFEYISLKVTGHI